MKLERAAIYERLLQLAKNDKQRQIFGARSHNYDLNPPIDSVEIDAFEKLHNIVLPEDYRHFITTIGNGGAGPAYGLFSFGHDDEGRWGNILPIGEVGQPFPHHEAWNLDQGFWEQEPNVLAGVPEDEEQKLVGEWDKKLEAHYWNPSITNGAIPICHLGCALRQWLVVHGEERGYVWDDMRADYAGMAPARDANGCPVTFTEWYLHWLEEAERVSKRLPIDHPQSRWTWLTLTLLVLVSVLLGLLFALQ